MWCEEFIMETKATKEKIWSLWSDVKNWSKWNIGIEYAHINGNFENGTWCSLKVLNFSGPFFIVFVLKDCIPNKSFIGRYKLSLCTIDFGYKLIEEENKLNIKHDIKMYGPLTFIYKNRIGKTLAKNIPNSVKKLVSMAGG
jgi:hypothetical protein